MGSFHIDEVISQSKKRMLMIGTWPEQSPSLTYKLVGSFTILIWIALTITTFTTALANIKDMAVVSYGVCVSLSAFHTAIKHLMFFYNKSKFYEILNCLKQPILVSHEDDLNIYLKNKIRLSKLWPQLFSLSCFSTMIIGLLCPVFDTKTERSLPLPFPINMKDYHWIFYCLVYVFQSIALFFIALGVPSYDGIIFTFIVIAAGQLKIVREKIVFATKFTSSATSSPKNRDSVINEILKQCVKHHMAIERLVGLIENTFSVGFLIQLFISLFITCFIGINSLFLPIASFGYLRGIFLFGAVLTELAFFCIPANEIILQSEMIQEACYMSEWTNCGSSVRKTLFIIMERSKRPFRLTAGKFVILSLNTLVTVLKSSFSYFTVIKNVYADSKKN